MVFSLLYIYHQQE